MIETIKMKDVNSVAYDKFLIAAAIRKSTFKDELGCSLLVSGALKNCKHCELKSICRDVDVAAENYIKDTTVSVKTFEF